MAARISEETFRKLTGATLPKKRPTGHVDVPLGPTRTAPLTLTLPWPPSMNSYWRHVGHKVLISKEGREYRAKVMPIMAYHGTFHGDVSVSIRVNPPDERVRDLDNLLKPTIDCLQAHGVLVNDSQVARLSIERDREIERAKMIVTVEVRP